MKLTLLPVKMFRGFSIFLILTLLLVAVPRQSAAQQTASGVYSEDFTTYQNLDYTDQATWDVFDASLRLRRSNGTLANYGIGNSSLVWDGQGHYYLTWTDSRQVHYDNYLQKLDADGNRLWPQDVWIGQGTLPNISVGEDGCVYAVWRGIVNSYYGIVFRKIKPDGTSPMADPIPLATGNVATPHIASAGGGNFWVEWVSFTDNGSVGRYFDDRFVVEKVNAAGQALVGPLVVNKALGSDDIFLGGLAADSAGRAWVLWRDNPPQGSLTIYLQAVNPDGSLLFADDQIVGLTTSNPSIASAPDGAIVGWDSSGYGFRLSRYTASGLAWTSNSPLMPTANNPGLSVDASGAIWAVTNPNTTMYLMKYSAAGAAQFSEPVRFRYGAAGVSTWVSISAGGPRPLAAWYDTRTGNQEVRLQMFAADGAPLWPADRPVNDEPGTALQEYPALAASPDGTQYIAWQDNRRGENNLYLQSLNPDGSRRWNADILVNTPTPLSSPNPPHLVVDPAGRVFVGWSEHGDLGAQYGEGYVQQFDSDGNKIWAEPLHVFHFEQSMSIVADPAGGFAVAWSNAGASDSLLVQRYQADGTPRWAAPLELPSTTIPYYRLVSLAAAPDSSLVLTWDGDSQHWIYVQRIGPDGTPQWSQPVTTFATPTTDYVYNSNVAVDSAGNAYVVWNNWAPGTTPPPFQTFGQKLSPAGERLWNSGSPVVLGDISYAPLALIVNKNDHPVVAIQSPDHFDILQYSPQASLDWQAAYTPSTGAYTAMYPVLAADGAGRIDVAWADMKSGNWDIFTNQLSPAGVFQHNQPGRLVNPDSFYLLTGTADSKTVDALPGSVIIANLTADSELNGGQVAFSLSNNGGQTWEPVAPGVNHRFRSLGSDLRWKADLSADPLWPRGPVVRSLTINFTALPPGADIYEIDDTCSQASPLETEGVAQAHTFHVANDEDWVRFDAQAGQTYTVQANNAAENIAVALELYDACGASTPVAWSSNPASRDARFEWTAAQDGPIYLRARNTSAGSGLPANSGYNLLARVVDTSPLVVLAVGWSITPEEQVSLDAAGDRLYNTFLAAQTAKNRIRYLSPTPNRDVDGNGLPDDTYGAPYHDAVRDAIQDWARSSGAMLGVPVYVYLLGPSDAADNLFNANPGENIRAEELNLWLGNLEATTGVERLTVVIDAPYSGSFIDGSSSNPATLSAANRVTITSTSPTLASYLLPDGTLFSDAFANALGQELNLRAAFDAAAQVVHDTVGEAQQPWIDDNGDAVADNLPGAAAAAVGAAAAAPTSVDYLLPGIRAQNRGLTTDLSAAPEILEASLTRGDGSTLLARARDDGSVTSVTAEARLCSFWPAAGSQPILHPSPVNLTPVSGQPGWYRADVNPAQNVCRYDLVATDNEGIRSDPYRLPILYLLDLPVIRR